MISKKTRLSPVALCCAGLLAACMPAPSTNAGFRSAPSIVGSSSHTVARPASAVEASLNRYARTCIDGKAFQTTTTGGTSYQVSKDYYYARIVTEGGIRSLVIKREMTALNMVYLDPSHEGPQYFVLADIQQIDSGHTRLDIRNVKLTGTKLLPSLLAWAEGSSQSCPDLSRI